MKCGICNSSSVQHTIISYVCDQCGDDHYHEPIDHCPKCKQRDSYFIRMMYYECLQCDAGMHCITSEWQSRKDSYSKCIEWSNRYPIDFESLCIEAFKPSRVMYQLSIDPDYYE